MPSSEHTIAIVSFEGALKREIKRVRRYLQQNENLSEFKLTIIASGRISTGDVKLTFKVDDGNYDGKTVTGDAIQPVLDEYMRRHGWERLHAPKAIGYERIPSDDTEEAPDTATPEF